MSPDRSNVHPSLHLSLADEDASSSIHPSVYTHTSNSDPPHTPDWSCRSWNRQEAAELQVGRVGGSGHCGNYWTLVGGGGNDCSYIETSHRSGILKMVWPFCAPTVTWFSYSPVECVCNTLCSSSVWYPDWEPIYRHYPSTRACSRIQTPRLSPAGTVAQMFLNSKPLRQHRILFWKAALCNSTFVLLGVALSFNTWTSAAPTHPACRSVLRVSKPS